MEGKEKQLLQFVVTMMKERNGISFSELYNELVNNGMIQDTREDRKRIVAFIRDIEIDGVKGSLFVCPLRKK